jgi:hypothetical protein
MLPSLAFSFVFLSLVSIQSPRESATIQNTALRVTLRTSDATLTVLDRRTGKSFEQVAVNDEARVQSVKSGKEQITVQLSTKTLGLPLVELIRLDGDKPEFTVELQGAGKMDHPLEFPHPFKAVSGDRFILPMNEGLAFPVEDQDPRIPTWPMSDYEGSYLSMPFWGATNGGQAYMAIVETENDAQFYPRRVDGLLTSNVIWQPQLGKFGYNRRIRFAFFDQGGYVAMAKRYRAYAKQTGNFVTLEEKRKLRPAVDQLVGAADFWDFGSGDPSIIREMKELGFDRMLINGDYTPDQIAEFNRMGYLTGNYDLYQDIMDPSKYPLLVDPNTGVWIPQAWPNQVVMQADGTPVKGWLCDAKDGSKIACSKLDDQFAPPYARERIAKVLATRPYKARFIDTVTATGLNEDYNPAHPMNRTQSRAWRNKLLDVPAKEFRLVTGSEQGNDTAITHLDYEEGMMSFSIYRPKDSGYDMGHILSDGEVTPAMVDFQVGERYRIPLWELVYHDCVVSFPYWGDFNNKAPLIWHRRDLFNILYGTPPLYAIKPDSIWKTDKKQFIDSYRSICPVVRNVGYSEMTNHRDLTKDFSVQQTVWSNGTVITVNFGAQPFQLPDGAMVPASGSLVQMRK